MIYRQASVLDWRSDLPGYGGEGHVHLRVSEHQPPRPDHTGIIIILADQDTT
jgi:hypothetical protein